MQMLHSAARTDDPYNRLTVAEEEWIKLARSMTDERLSRRLDEFGVGGSWTAAALRALAGMALVRARRIDTLSDKR